MDDTLGLVDRLKSKAFDLTRFACGRILIKLDAGRLVDCGAPLVTNTDSVQNACRSLARCTARAVLCYHV